LVILITGGTGFIGSYLARKLVNETREDVILYDLLPNLTRINDIKDKITLIQGDILDFEKLKETVKTHKVDRIVHLAFYLPPASEQEPIKGIKINCEGTANVFEIGKIFNLDKIVYASSIAVNGPPSYYRGKVLDEDDERKPKTLYGTAKVLNEDLATYYNEKFGLEFIGLRFGVVYGYGRARGGGLTAAAIVDVVENPVLGKPVKVPLGDWELNVVYVKDVANALFLALQAKKLEHKIFYICGEVTTPRKIAEQVKKIIPEASIQVEPGNLDLYHTLFNISRAKKELGWAPIYNIEKGVTDYITTFKRQMFK